MFGWDILDQTATRVEDLPLIGEPARDLLLGQPFATEDDPLALQYKGPLWDRGMVSVASPIVVPTGASPVLKFARDVWNGMSDLYHGNPDQASSRFARIWDAINPINVNMMQQLRKSVKREDWMPDWMGDIVLQPDPDDPGNFILVDSKGRRLYDTRLTGLIQWLRQSAPGRSVAETKAFSLSRLQRRKDERIYDKRREMTLQWADFAAAKARYQETQAEVDLKVAQDLRAELGEFHKALKVPITKAHAVRGKRLHFERTKLDRQMRTVVDAGTKEEKVRALSALLEDPSYQTGREKWGLLLKYLGGKPGFNDWIGDKALPTEVRARFRKAMTARREMWFPPKRNGSLQPSR